MTQPKTNTHGELIVSSLSKLDDPSLENWIRAQIRGENLSITGDVHSGGRPCYLLIHIFGKLASGMHQRIRRILLKFLSQLKTDKNDWDNESSIGLLLLVEPYFCRETSDKDDAIRLLEKICERYVNEKNLDLQRRTLQELLGLEYRALDSEFWFKAAKSSDDFFGLALHGLFLRDWREALEFLPSMPDSKLAFSQVVSTLNYMFKRFPELQPEHLRKVASGNNQWVKDAVNHVLKLREAKNPESSPLEQSLSLDVNERLLPVGNGGNL